MKILQAVCKAVLQHVVAYLVSKKAHITMHSSAKFKSPPLPLLFFCSCDKVYHKQAVLFLLYLLGQIVT